MKRISPLRIVGSACLTLAIACSTGPADPDSDAYQPPDPTTERDSDGLTPPSDDPPDQIVLGYLAGKRDGLTIGSATTSRVFAGAGGITHVRLEQQIDGVPVYGSYVRGAVDADGRLVSIIDGLATVSPSGVLSGSATEQDALEVTLANLYPTFDTSRLSAESQSGTTTTYTADSFFYRAPTVSNVIVPTDTGKLEDGYLVETWTNDDNVLYHTVIGKNGKVLYTELRTNTDSYNIFPDHPGISAQTVVAGPGGWLHAGDHLSQDIRGPNVNAYLDTNNSNSSDNTGTTISDGNFVAIADLGSDPNIEVNQDVAVQNLFYFNNLIHDKLEAHGFDNAAGNFEGDDPVNAEAQDGGGTNNANMSTPSDGSSPRMQMYLWTQSSPRRDGDLDSDIVWHEYGHGLTWRMIGSMSGPMSGAIGEGMSDVLSLLANDDPVVGEYSFNDPNGIRSAPYDDHPATYSSFTGGSVHSDGEIYAATIWDLKVAWEAAGHSEDELYEHLVRGMNFTNPGPAMEDMRDGILAYASNNGSGVDKECLVWEAFANRGIGVGASASVKGGGPFGGGRVTVNESFDLPIQCQGPCDPTCDGSGCGGSDGCGGTCDATNANTCGLCDNPIPACDTDADCSGTDLCVGAGECDAICSSLLPDGASCTDDTQCVSEKCKGPPGGKTCK